MVEKKGGENEEKELKNKNLDSSDEGGWGGAICSRGPKFLGEASSPSRVASRVDRSIPFVRERR